MKEYLIEIRSNRGSIEAVSINGDTPSCPFSISGNLWLYMTPWNAARRLELLAKSWEKHGYNVEWIYGTVEDMGTKGSEYNVAMVLNSWKK
jgi:hypothetical protein